MSVFLTVDLLFTMAMCAALLLGGGLALYSLLTLDVDALMRGGRALVKPRPQAQVQAHAPQEAR